MPSKSKDSLNQNIEQLNDKVDKLIDRKYQLVTSIYKGVGFGVGAILAAVALLALLGILEILDEVPGLGELIKQSRIEEAIEEQVRPGL